MAEMDPLYENALFIWGDVADLSRSYAPDPTIQAWVGRLKPVSFDGSTFVAATQLRWTERKIMTTYREVIEHFLYEITLEHVSFSVVVDPSLFQDGAPAATPVGAMTPVSAAAPATSVAVTGAAPVATAPVAPMPTAPAAPQPAMSASPQPIAPAAVPAASASDPAMTAGARQGATAGGATTFVPPKLPKRPLPHMTHTMRTPMAPAPGVGNAGAVVAASAATPLAPQAAEMAPTVSTPAATGPEASALPTDVAAEVAAEVLAEDTPDVTEEGISITLDSTVGADQQTQAVETPLANYTFDTFVVGEANRMAFEVARAAAEGDKLPGNPVFIYSKSGLGKTHLLLSILNYIRTNRPGVEVVYATSNGFVEDYVDEMQNRRVRGKEVMKRYRTCDVLLVDDVQFFVKKQESVTTFFDIFNSLTMAGKTIVLSADEPPDYLQLDDRIKTRFSMGTVLDIAQPSYELKRMILQSTYDRRRSEVSWLRGDLVSQQLDWIAEYSPNNIREMQGFLNRVMLRSSQGQGGVVSEDQIKAIRDEIFQSERKVEIPTIIKFVAKEYGVSESDVRGQRRTKMVSEARQVSMWLARQMTDDSYQSIGNYFSRDHSTVYNSIMKIDKMSQDDRSFMGKLESFERSIKNR